MQFCIFQQKLQNANNNNNNSIKEVYVREWKETKLVPRVFQEEGRGKTNKDQEEMLDVKKQIFSCFLLSKSSC